MRITTQLIEAETNRHIWAERYDRAIDDIFAVQDDITMSTVAAIEPSLRKPKSSASSGNDLTVSMLTISYCVRCLRYSL